MGILMQVICRETTPKRNLGGSNDSKMGQEGKVRQRCISEVQPQPDLCGNSRESMYHRVGLACWTHAGAHKPRQGDLGGLPVAPAIICLIII